MQREARWRDQQKSLVDLKVIEIIGEILTTSKDFSILNSSLELLNRLMEGPNHRSQAAVIEYFKSPERAPLFVTLEKLIMSSLDGVVEVVEQQNQYNLNRSLRGVANKQTFDRIEANMKMENYDIKMDFITLFFQCFIGLMVNNDEGRAFMREPVISEHGKQSFSLTLITFSAKILAKVLKCPHKRCLQLADIILVFLLECIIGPSPDNQEEVMKTGFIDCVKDLLNEYNDGLGLEAADNSKESKALRHLCTKSIIVIKYILEGNRRYLDNRLKIAQLISPTFLLKKIKDDLKAYLAEQSEGLNDGLRQSLTSKVGQGHANELPFTLENLKKIYSSKELIDEDLTNIFEQFFVLKMILPSSSAEKDLISRVGEDETTTYSFLEMYSGSIEVIFENNIQKVYLEVQPLFKYMDEEEMQFLMTNVSRDTPKNKLNDFLNIMPKIFDLISYKATLKRSGAFFSAQIFRVVERVNFATSLILNFLILAFFEQRLDYGYAVTNEDFDETNIWIKVAIHLHLAALAFRLFIFFYFQCRIALMHEWRDVFERVSSRLRQKNLRQDSDLQTVSQKRYVDITIKERIQLFAKYNELEGYSVNYPPMDYFFQCALMISRLVKFRILALYTLVTIFAYVYGIFFFYSLLMLDVVVNLASLELAGEHAKHREVDHDQRQAVHSDGSVCYADHLHFLVCRFHDISRRFSDEIHRHR